MLPQILSISLSCLLGFISSVLLDKYRKVNKKKDDLEEEKNQLEKDALQTNELLRKGVMHLLKQTLKETNDYHVSKGYCSVEEKDEIEQTYKTYHALGGNGVGTRLYRELMDLPDHLK